MKSSESPEASHGGSTPPTSAGLPVQELDRALHRDRLQGAGAAVERVVEEPQQQQQRRDQDRHPAHHRRLHERPLSAVREEEHEHEQDRGTHEEDDPQRRWNDALAAVRAVGASILAVGTLVEVFRERRLLRRGARLGPPEAAEHGDPPRVQLVVEGPRLHPRPFLVHHAARVAHELPRNSLARRGR